MHAGPRQRFLNQTIPITGVDNLQLAITGCFGARFLLVKLHGGTTGGVLTTSAVLTDLGDSNSATTIGLTPKGAGGAVTNRAEADAWYFQYIWEPVTGSYTFPFALPRVQLFLSVATDPSLNAEIDVWPMFDTAEAMNAGTATNLRIA